MKAVPSVGGHPVLMFQRVSTESSVKLDAQPLATRWIWYWQGQMKDWKKYGDVRHPFKSALNF